MNLADELGVVIANELKMDGEINRERLCKNLLVVMDRYREHVDGLAAQLHRLVGEETALTIPLADGCVAKVRFSQAVTHKNMITFAKIFNAIAENYAAPSDTEEQP